MSGSLGGGRSSSSQQSSSEGYSQSEQASASQSQSQSRQNIAFQDVFSDLYNNASAATQRTTAGAGNLMTAAQQLFSGGNQFLRSLGNDEGSTYLEDRLSSDNPVLEQQISQLREDTGRLFSEELNPAIISRAVGGGTLGGGRQGVAQGLAIDSASRAFSQGATALRAGDIAQRDAAAQSIAQNSLQATSTGLGALPSLLSLLDSGNNAELGAYQRLGSILGGPTTLTSSDSTSIAQALSRAYGEQSSQSTGRSRAWNFDTSASFL